MKASLRIASKALTLARALDGEETVVSLRYKLEKLSIEYELRCHEGCCYSQYSRNELLLRFRQSGAEELYFLDDDQVGGGRVSRN